MMDIKKLIENDWHEIYNNYHPFTHRDCKKYHAICTSYVCEF